MTNKILCVIPARGGSKGVVRKNTRDVGGKPLIHWAIKAVKDSGVVDKVVVSTEDNEIADIARACGAEIVIRPTHLAEDEVPTEPVMLHALEEAEKVGFNADYIILVQCTSPFLTGDVVKEVVDTLLQNTDRFDSCGTYYQPHYAFRWKKTEKNEFVSEYPVMNRPRRQDLVLEYPFCGAGACYVISTLLFKKTGNRYGGDNARIGGVIIPEADALQIDTEYDLWLANLRMLEKLRNKI